MKRIEIKKGAHTIYKWVPDDYKEEERDFVQRDLTTSGRKCLDTGLTKERYDEIFGKKDNKIK